MKNRIRTVAVLACSIFNLSLAAQPPLHQVLPVRPLLFNHLPQKTILAPSLFEQLFSADAGQNIHIPLGEGKFLDGIVKEKTLRNKYVTSLTIECTNYDGALLTFSRISAGNAPVTYSGRVVNIRYGDVLLLTQENNRYYLTKQKQSLVLVE